MNNENYAKTFFDTRDTRPAKRTTYFSYEINKLDCGFLLVNNVNNERYAVSSLGEVKDWIDEELEVFED